MSPVDNLEIEFTGIDLCDNILPFDGKFHIVPQLKSFQKLTEKDAGKIKMPSFFNCFCL